MRIFNFSSKFIKAAYWSALQALFSVGFSFVFSIILARILTPKEFGLLSMIVVFNAVGEALINSGLSQSLIRSKTVSNGEYSSIFYLNIILSITIYILLYFAAPIISDFYNEPLLTEIGRVYFLILLIRSFSIVQYTVLIKSLDFKAYFFVTVPSVIVAGIIAALLARFGFGVWSLVFYAIIQSVLEVIQYWFNSKWRPLFHFDLVNIKHHINFGYKLTISTFINTILTNLQAILIGKNFSTESVGLYTRANSFKQLPADLMVHIMGKVSQPIFAQIQDDDEKLKYTYHIILQTALFFVSPVLFFIFFFANPFFNLLLTEKWNGIVPVFRIICITGILYPFHVFNLHIINVKGRSDLNLKLEIIKGGLIVIVLFMSIMFGFKGLLYGTVILSIISLFINSYYSKRFLNYSIFEQFRDLWLFIVIAFLSALGAYLLVEVCFNELLNIYKVAIGFIVVIVLYLGSSFISKPFIIRELILNKLSHKNV